MMMMMIVTTDTRTSLLFVQSAHGTRPEGPPTIDAKKGVAG
jgi:hypothetical protein